MPQRTHHSPPVNPEHRQVSPEVVAVQDTADQSGSNRTERKSLDQKGCESIVDAMASQTRGCQPAC